MGGTRGCHFDGTNFKPRKTSENAPTPTTMAPAFFAGDRVHAGLGSGLCASGVANDTCLPLNEGKRDYKATAGASALIITKAFNPNPASMGQNDATSNR